MNFAQWIFNQNSHQLDKTAIVDNRTSLTYRELQIHTWAYSQYLINRGCVPGDRAIISLDDCVEWVVIFLGCIAAGVNPVLVSNCLPKSTIEKISKIIGTSLIIDTTDNVLLHTDQPINFYEFKHNDPCFWLMSSGTTGEPKFVVHKHSDLQTLLELIAYPAYRVDNNSRILSTAKLSFTYGFNNSLTFGLGKGATVFLNSGVLAAKKIFEKLSLHKITHFFTVPSVVRSMLQNGKDNKISNTVTTMVSSGEALPLSIAMQFETKHNIKILDGLGMSEVMYNYCTQTEDNIETGTIGQPITGIECEIRDNHGNIIQDNGVVGELYVKHPCAALYYWNDDYKTKSTFINGWVKTNDKVFRNLKGNYVYIARSDDLIKINGLYVSPVEIESKLLEINEISECAVISKHSDLGLLEIHAYITLNNDISNSKINNLLRLSLPAHKIPKYYHKIDSIPKSITGKISRNSLKRR